MSNALRINLQYRLIGVGPARLDLDINFILDQMSKSLSNNNHQISNSALSSAQFIAYMLYFKRHRFCIQHNGSIIQINKLSNVYVSKSHQYLTNVLTES